MLPCSETMSAFTPHSAYQALAMRGYLVAHAKRTAASIVALGLTGAPNGLSLNKGAQAVTQIDQLQQVEVGLDKRIPAADAAIGTTAAHKSGRIAGAHDDKLDIADRALAGTRIATAHDQVTAGVAQLGDVQARGLEHVERVGLKRALGNGDAQRTLSTTARGVVAVGSGVLSRSVRGLQTLERKGKSRRRYLDAIAERAGKDGVVATARTHRIGQATGIGLKDQARVVIKRVHDGEVEGQHLGVLGSQALDQGTQLARQRRDDTGSFQQRIHTVEYLGTAVQARQLANGGLDGLGLGACRHAGIEAHKVIGVHAAQGLGSQLAILARREQLLKRTHATCDNARIGNASLRTASATSETISTSPAVSPAPISSKPSCVNWREPPALRWHSRTTGAS